MKYHVMFFIAGELRWLAKEYGRQEFYVARDKSEKWEVNSKRAANHLREIAFELEPSFEAFVVVQ